MTEENTPVEGLDEASNLLAQATGMLGIMRTADYDNPTDGKGRILVDTSTVQYAIAGIEEAVYKALWKIEAVKTCLEEELQL